MRVSEKIRTNRYIKRVDKPRIYAAFTSENSKIPTFTPASSPAIFTDPVVSFTVSTKSHYTYIMIPFKVTPFIFVDPPRIIKEI